MTIAEDTFDQVRDDNPDLDAEIRSILMARAQTGATISDIKMDYQKNTGLHFPIFDKITDFLLTIPMVTAMCNQRGTQIFNIMPTEKTQHLFNLVMGQKTQQQQQQQYQQQDHQTAAPRKWRHNLYRKDTFYNRNSSNNNYNNNNYYYNNNNHNNNNQYRNYSQVSNARQMQQLSQNFEQQQQQRLIQTQRSEQQQIEPQLQSQQYQQLQSQQVLSMAKQASVVECQSDFDKDGNYYQDNCNHLYSRLYNQQLIVTPLSAANYNSDVPIKAVDQKSHIQQQQQHNQNVQVQQQQQQQKPNNHKEHIKEVFVSATDNENVENQKCIKRKRGNPLKKFMNNGNVNNNGSFCRYSTTSYAKSSQCNDSCYISCDSEYEAHLYDFPILGDDFFLFLARMELNCKFKMNETVYQAGLCVSGQTIRAAIMRVQQLSDCNHRIIVNIGSVDIMRGRKLLQIEHDYRELINVMHKKGLTPILTTLAPLANYMHIEEMKRMWERFNDFIKRIGSFLLVVDIWSCMVNERGQTLFDCYQKGPRSVTGASEPYVFWNKIGRQRILQKILSSLEY